MHDLTLLANKYNSDKGTTYGSKHNFTEIYSMYFEPLKNKSLRILEIGVNDGSSLKIWYDYFPNAIIYGLDIDDKTQYNNDRISCGILDQSEKEHLKYFADNIDTVFDIILDDGSHHISDQQITLGYLFPLLNEGGVYVLEDLHTSLCTPGTILYGRPMENNPERNNDTLYFLKNRPFNSLFLTEKQNKYLEDFTQEVLIFEKDNENVPSEYGNKSITSIIRKCK